MNLAARTPPALASSPPLPPPRRARPAPLGPLGRALLAGAASACLGAGVFASFVASRAAEHGYAEAMLSPQGGPALEAVAGLLTLLGLRVGLAFVGLPTLAGLSAWALTGGRRTG